MSELGEIYESWNEAKREKKAQNKTNSIAILDERGVEYKLLSADHLRVGEYDFWPSTGLFIHMRTGKKARGIFNLLERLGRK